ncbi:hypothetical protein EWF20_04980 [Sulfolobus sp. S-194]|uniref:hypothetical protein n=1 Tax=Sulfolobus sp. S-194 TaxID=2512240 RepID=UPI0014371055|nr:hypothetical protein [Sulfolobus sp. S-194]QIW23574.1 hypothetical protein EWF20_04980 [Sulfolobus sp. S-194]
MSDFDPIEEFRKGEEFARKVYLRKARKTIGLFYLIISTYIPLSIGLSVAYSYFLINIPFSYLIRAVIYSPLIYVLYIIFSSILLFKLRKIPEIMKKINEINRTRFNRVLFSKPFYFFLSIGTILLLNYATVIVGGEIGEILGTMENFIILLLIIKYFHSVFSMLKVDKPSKEDYIALIGAIIGFSFGTFVSTYFFLIFSVSWLYAGLSILKKYR